jgi:transposase-like protein
MKTKPILSPKAAVQLLFKTEDLHPQMGNLGAKEIIKSLNHSFFDHDFCLKFILGAVHRQSSPKCPHCGEPLPPDNHGKFWNNQQFYCPSCRKKSHATTKTPLYGTSLSPSQIVCMSVLFLLGFTDGQVAVAVDSNGHTVKKWRNLLIHTPEKPAPNGASV